MSGKNSKGDEEEDNTSERSMEDRVSEKKQNEFKKEEVIIWLENAWDEDKEVVDYIQISNKYSQLNIQNTARSYDFFFFFFF